MRRSILLASAVWLIFSVSASSQDLDSIFNMQAFTEESALQKVINKDVAVSSVKLSSRETPGIVSVITREEIENSGSRDLTDVLRLVPGFEVLQDLQFVLGLSLRGSWANEGKVLILMDGVPFNDLLYQSVAIGNRFPVDAIERIEIIRGPGSALYGGSAEYGVINIITRAAAGMNGVAVYGTVGLHSNIAGRTTGGVMAGQKTDNYAWDVNVFKGKSIISDGIYEGVHDLGKMTGADPLNVNAGFTIKNLSVRGMYDEFEISEPYSNVSFRSTFAEVKYSLKASPRLTLTPQIQYLSQVPWKYTLFDEEGTAFANFETKANRSLAQLNAQYNANRKVNINFGALYFRDVSKDVMEGETLLELNNFAIYSQALFKHRLANATVGVRFEKNNRYSGAFVPRMALTKKIENLHFKVLYSKSFRSPSLQNVLLDTTGAKPEKSNVFEIEVGYQFTPEMLLAVNAFHITTKDIIIYGYEEDEEWYENYEKSGSKGIELVYSLKRGNWYSNLTYSLNQAIKGNTVDKYQVPQTDKQYVGISATKVTLNAGVTILNTITINPSVIHAGKRYAFTEVTDDGPVATEIEPYTLVNLFINYKPKVLPGMTVGAGVFDLLNERPVIPQAYNGDIDTYIPIPGRSREYVVKLSYQLNFAK